MWAGTNKQEWQMRLNEAFSIKIEDQLFVSTSTSILFIAASIQCEWNVRKGLALSQKQANDQATAPQPSF